MKLAPSLPPVLQTAPPREVQFNEPRAVVDLVRLGELAESTVVRVTSEGVFVDRAARVGSP